MTDIKPDDVLRAAQLIKDYCIESQCSEECPLRKYEYDCRVADTDAPRGWDIPKVGLRW